jgi:hypothetical protein
MKHGQDRVHLPPSVCNDVETSDSATTLLLKKLFVVKDPSDCYGVMRCKECTHPQKIIQGDMEM